MNQRSAIFAMAVVSTIFLSVVVVLVFFAVPVFHSTFENFGATIPSKTQFVISSYQYWVIFPFVPFVIAVRVYKTRELTKSFSKYAGLLSIAAFIFAWFLIAFTLSAMYEPIYGLSSHNK